MCQRPSGIDEVEDVREALDAARRSFISVSNFDR
jgi:hypothetical protein